MGTTWRRSPWRRGWLAPATYSPRSRWATAGRTLPDRHLRESEVRGCAAHGRTGRASGGNLKPPVALDLGGGRFLLEPGRTVFCRTESAGRRNEPVTDFWCRPCRTG